MWLGMVIHACNLYCTQMQRQEDHEFKGTLSFWPELHEIQSQKQNTTKQNKQNKTTSERQTMVVASHCVDS